MKKYLLPMILILVSCNSNDKQNLVNKAKEIGDLKIEKAVNEARLNKDDLTKVESMNFEEQINKLEDLGLLLNNEIEITEIFDGEFGKLDYEEQGILFTLRELGRPKFKKNKGKLYFGENVYTLVAEDFNIDQYAFEDLFNNVSRISNQSIVFKDLKFVNAENSNLEKRVSFRVDDKLISWNYNYNDGYFDAQLIPEICEVLKMKNINAMFWSQDGLSHTILIGDETFLNRMSQYLKKSPC